MVLFWLVNVLVCGQRVGAILLFIVFMLYAIDCYDDLVDYGLR